MSLITDHFTKAPNPAQKQPDQLHSHDTTITPEDRFSQLSESTRLRGGTYTADIQLASQFPVRTWKQATDKEWYQTVDNENRPFLKVKAASLQNLHQFFKEQKVLDIDKIPFVALKQWQIDKENKTYWYYDQRTKRTWYVPNYATLRAIYEPEQEQDESEDEQTDDEEEEDTKMASATSDSGFLAPLPSTEMRCALQPTLPKHNIVPIEDQPFFKQVLSMIQHIRDGWAYDASAMVRLLKKMPDYQWEKRLKAWWKAGFIVGEDVHAVVDAIENYHELRSQAAMSNLIHADGSTGHQNKQTTAPYVKFIRKPTVFDIESNGDEVHRFVDIVAELKTGPRNQKEANNWSRHILGKWARTRLPQQIRDEEASWAGYMSIHVEAKEAICSNCGYIRWINAAAPEQKDDFKCGDACQVDLQLSCADRKDQLLHTSWACFAESRDPSIPVCKHLVEVWVERVKIQQYVFF